MPIRIISPLNRLPHVSFEEFDRHWGQVHRPLIEALPGVKSGLVKYRQFHVSPETNAALAARGLPVMPHDGIAEWAAEKLEDILEVWASDEIVKTILPDEKNFFERSSVQVIAGDWTE
ncbi:EthD domain-containing protein [Mycena epipterygia]|nr:EthD domain-containing protein [Mycena epipterygia]